MVVLENKPAKVKEKSNKHTGLRGVNLPALLIFPQARSCPKLVSIAPVEAWESNNSGRLMFQHGLLGDSNVNLISQVNRKKLIRHFQLWCAKCLWQPYFLSVVCSSWPITLSVTFSLAVLPPDLRSWYLGRWWYILAVHTFVAFFNQCLLPTPNTQHTHNMPVDDLAGDFGNSLGKVFGATPQVQPRFEAGKLN